MATVPKNKQISIQQTEDLLKVSAYDRASSLLISLLVLIGTAVTMLFIVWLTSRVFWVPTQAVFELLEEEDGTQNPPGTARDINEPGIEELEDLQEPDVQDMLAAVTDAVSTVAASLDAIDGVVATRGSGMGDNRKRGNPTGVIPRHERWEIQYLDTTLKQYQKQLAFFKVELGCFGGSQGVEYLLFTQGGGVQKRTESDPSKDERLYFIWQGGPFKELDRKLLQQNGISTTGRHFAQFFSAGKDGLENRLANLEENERGERPLKDIKKTIFGVQGTAGNYQFYVMEIRWR